MNKIHYENIECWLLHTDIYQASKEWYQKGFCPIKWELKINPLNKKNYKNCWEAIFFRGAWWIPAWKTCTNDLDIFLRPETGKYLVIQIENSCMVWREI